MSDAFNLKRDFANITDGTSMILVALGFRSRRLRDFICSVQGVAGARHEFDCTHLALARRLDHSGRVEAAELFVTRYLAALEKEQRRVGRYLFRIERGGGFERKPTHYVDHITRAAIFVVQQARQSALWKESHTRAMAEFIPEAVEMLPIIEEEPQNMPEADTATPPGVQLARNEHHALSRARSNLNIVKESGGDVVTYAESLIARFTADILERAHLVQENSEGKGIKSDTHAESQVDENIEESNLQAALDYAQWDDLPVFPVRADKAPYTANGFKDASLDSAMIRQYWHKWPDANIGIPTGEPSGLLALDIDPRHGGDASLTTLIEQNGDKWLETMQARTGGGGHHIIFAHPKGSNIRNSAGRLGEGIDVRGDGGYIVVPPSLHASGRRYEWLNNLKPIQPPEWLLKLLTEERGASMSKAQPRATSGASIGAVIPDGERNESLFKIASSLRGKGAEHDEIESELLRINRERCSPPLPDSEVLKIARSAARLAANRVAVGA
ncbi:MAG TPA: bifunctional DNA primase/polymerase [Pyrinomonadaceae bacterium]|nr:bifunctional DNA primase/polymerase [Pyrinomonadaceae bacterium]